MDNLITTTKIYLGGFEQSPKPTEVSLGLLVCALLHCNLWLNGDYSHNDHNGDHHFRHHDVHDYHYHHDAHDYHHHDAHDYHIIITNDEYREIFKGVAATGARIWWWAGAALELAGDGYHDHNDHYGAYDHNVYDHDHGYNDHNDHNVISWHCLDLITWRILMLS